MKKLFYLFMLPLFLLGTSTNGFAMGDCCGNALNPVFTPTGCGEFDICLEGYENCDVTDIWTFGLPNVVWPRTGNCISLSGFNDGDVLNFYIQVGVNGCSNYFESASYTVTDFGCGTDPCCDSNIAYDLRPNGECGSFDICLLGLENCNVTGIVPSYVAPGTGNIPYSVNGNCVTFSGLNVGDQFQFSLTVQIDGCDDVILDNITYVVTEDGCDPCCLPPDINDVIFYQIPGWNWLRICMPEAPCPDQEGLLYNISFLEKCGEDPGIYSISSSTTNCLYLRFQPCCEYRIQVSYSSDDCSSVQWSGTYVFESDCPDGSGITTTGESAFAEGREFNKQETGANSAVVLPNPFTDEFQIQCTTQKEEPYQLMIYDLQGKVVLNLSGKLSKGQNSISVNQLTDMPSGNYFYQLISESQRFSDKLVKF